MRTLVRSVLQCRRSPALLYDQRDHRRVLVQIRLMSSSENEKAANPLTMPLDKSPENWFAKFSRAEDTPKGCFKGFSDRFNGITVDSILERSEEEFEAKLTASIAHWQSVGRRGIWFKVNLKESDWVPVLAKHSFTYHHARNDFVMMFRWLPENSANVPPYAHTLIGVGAIVINEKEQILAVSEKNALIPNSWKLPGGYAEPRENLPDSAAREVFEETNITAKFDSVVAIRHAHGAGFGCSDVYVVVAMTAETMDIKKCEREIADCKWMELEEFLTHDNVHETNRNFLRTYVSLKRQGIKIGCHEEIHPIIKKKYQIYDVITENSRNSSL